MEALVFPARGLSLSKKYKVHIESNHRLTVKAWPFTFIANNLSSFHGRSLSSRISTQTETAIFPGRSLRASGIISLISASLESWIQTSECRNTDLYTEGLTFMLCLHSSTMKSTTLGLWETNQTLRDQTGDLFCLRISSGVVNGKKKKKRTLI